MQPIVLVTDPEGRIEAFSSVQFAIEDNNFNSGNYRFYWSQSISDLHQDSARGMSLPELYLEARYNPQRLRWDSNHWLNPNAMVIIKHVDSSSDCWTMQFTYLYV